MNDTNLDERVFFAYMGEAYDITDEFPSYSQAGWAFREIKGRYERYNNLLPDSQPSRMFWFVVGFLSAIAVGFLTVLSGGQ